MEQKKKTKAEARRNETNPILVGTSPEKNIVTRGRIFEGIVTKKFSKRVVLEFERMIYVRKYERYAKLKTKLHARLPDLMENQINIGDLIRVQECRPLSKIIHFVVIEKLKDVSEVRK